MNGRDYSRRVFLRNVVVLGGGSLVLSGCTSTPVAQPTSEGAGRGGGSVAGLPDIEGAELITDPARIPTSFRESPDFAKLVADGKLPAVAERIGSNPLVLKPVHGIGQYGGQIRRGFVGQGDFQNAVRFCSGPDSLLYWDYRYERVIPNIARDFELSEDGKVLTLHLRKGMRWSDGRPLTADDILFWREDVSLNPELTSGSASMKVNGQDVTVEKVDDLTVRYVSMAPNPLLPQRMAGWGDLAGMVATAHLGGGGFMPKHYLSQFHPKYTSVDAANKLAADAGFKGWAAFFRNQTSWHRNPQLPVVTPWVLSRPISDPPWEFAANPYSIWVDAEGNQLPYISKITLGTLENIEVLSLRAAAGEFDAQDRHLGVGNLPVLLENEQRGGYKIHRTAGTELDCGIRLNLAYEEDKELGDLIRTVEFRRALSMGIDRDQVNEAFFLGTSVPTATMAAEGSVYDPGPEWRLKWATHDPAQANALLDGIGLTKKDGEGYRLRRDGAGRIRLDFDAGLGAADFRGVAEMVKEQWRQIGIDASTLTLESNLAVQRAVANQLAASVASLGTDDPYLKGDTFLPTVTNNYPGLIGIPYAQWFASGGSQGKEPPESLRLLKDAMALLQQGLTEPNEEERVRIGKELYKMHADQVWSIGIVGFGLATQGVYLTNGKLRNVPARVVNSLQMKSMNNTYPMTYYYE